jgi:hypothetical protein
VIEKEGEMENKIPTEIQRGMMETAREQAGSGYVPEYYAQIANDWEWLYEAGVKAGREAQSAASRKRRDAVRRKQRAEAHT